MCQTLLKRLLLLNLREKTSPDTFLENGVRVLEQDKDAVIAYAKACLVSPEGEKLKEPYYA